MNRSAIGGCKAGRGLSGSVGSGECEARLPAVRTGCAFVMLGALTVGIAPTAPALAIESHPLSLEAKIPLGQVKGRIDHLAIDAARQRLYVAELGNNSVGVIDLKDSKTVRTITGLREPQGIGYVPSSDTVYVANAADGTVRLFHGAELTPVGQIALGEDADNIRVDDAAHRVFIGYGSGSLAVIDTASQTKIADIKLKAHPESFQLERGGQHIFVNVPDSREIAVVDRSTSRQLASWPTNHLRANFPLALDESNGRLLAVFRSPAMVGVFSMQDGHLLSTLETCGDSDDVFVDSKRRRAYVICGQGFIDVLESRENGYVSVERIPTSGGARTGLFVPEIDRVLLAARATAAEPASIWVFRPSP
jgi:YVTN family beta-propeller protein